MPATHAQRHTLLNVWGRRPRCRSAPVGDYLVAAIEGELRVEWLRLDTFSALAPGSLLLAKTTSSRTLGFMTEMAAELGYAIPAAGGLSGCDCRRPQPATAPDAAQPRWCVTSIELVEATLAASA